jgi:hypothetical protein
MDILLRAFGHHHITCQKIVHILKGIRERRRTSISKNSVDWRIFGRVVSERVWVFLGTWVGFRVWAKTALLLRAFGHHHNNREKIVHMLESIRKGRGTRISKNFLYWIRFGGVVTEIVWVFLELGGFLGFGLQQHYYCELSATTTTTERK